MENDDFFLQPIKDLPFSDEFKHMAESHNLKTLHDLLEIEGADLVKKPGVTYHMVQEFVDYLEKAGQGHFFRE